MKDWTASWEEECAEFISNTAVFEKVYRTISQSKRRQLVFKTGVIMYIQNDTYKNYSKIFWNIYVLQIKT